MTTHREAAVDEAAFDRVTAGGATTAGEVPSVPTWRIARRFLRSRSLRWNVFPLAVVVAALTVSYLVLNALTLASGQIVERDLGRFDLSIQPGAATPLRGDPAIVVGPRNALSHSGSTETLVTVESRDVRPDVPQAPQVRYLEADWARHPFPHRYGLSSGRWPRGPGEVLVSQALAPFVRDGRLAVLSGAIQLRVTGVVHNRYATRSSEILAADGTWTSWAWPELETRFPNLVGSVTVFGVGGDPDRIVAALAALPQATRAGVTADQLRAGMARRDAILGLDRDPGVVRSPMAYEATSAVLVPLGVALVFALAWRRTSRELGVLRAVGLRAKDAIGAVLLATTTAVGIAVAVATAAGWGLGLIARWAVSGWAGQPLSPIADPWPLVSRIGGLAVLTAAVMALWVFLSHRQATVRILAVALPRRRTQRNLRHVLTAAAVVALVWESTTLSDTNLDLWVLPTAAVLVVLTGAGAMAGLLAALPGPGLLRRLVREGLRIDRVRVVTAIAMVAVTTGPVLAILVTNESSMAQQRRQAVSYVPPHQAYLTPVDPSRPLPPALVSVTQDAVGAGRTPITVARVGALDGSGIGAEHDGYGLVIAVTEPEDVSRLFQAPLGQAEQTVLRQGGFLLRGASTAPRPRPLYAVSRDLVITPTAPVPSMTTPFDPSWAQSWEAIVLVSTAQRQHWPITPAGLVYDDVANPAQVKEAVIKAGYDPQYLGIYRVPDVIGLSEAQRLTAVILAALLLLTVVALGRSQQRSLRPYAQLLVAIGLRRGFVGRVLALRLMLVVAAALVLAIPITAVSVGVLAWRAPEFVLAVPVLPVGGLVITVIGLAGLVTAWGAASLGRSSAGQSLTGRLAET